MGNLKKSIWVAIIGYVLIFIIKVVNAVLPELLRNNLILLRIFILILFLSTMAIVLFFYYFMKEYDIGDRKRLFNASILVLGGSVFMVLAYIEKVVFLFLPGLNLSFLSSVLVWLNLLYLVMFFWVFYRYILEEENVLKTPILLNAIFLSIILIFQTFFSTHLIGINWIFNLIFTIAILISYILIIWWLTKLWRFLNEREEF